MGNTESFCCKKQKNKDIDLTNLCDLNNKNNLSKIIKLQSHFRKFLTKIKTNKMLTEIPFSLIKAPGKIVDKSYSPKLDKINSKLLELISALGKFHLNTCENLLSSNENELKNLSILYNDKTFYKGFFNKHWKKEGFGMLYLPDGSRFEGFFKQDEMSGKGRLVNSEGFYYEGDFKNNKANGYGKYVNIDGTSYVGFWHDDKQNGFGEEFFNDGSKYEGNYIQGKKSGKGKFIWSGNSFYEGDFENNDLHGFGQYKWKDGRIYIGEWKKNKMDGIGLFIWPDNKKYLGSYRNDRKKGFGIFTWPDGKSFEGEWAEGKQNGFGIFKNKEGIKYGEWQSGNKLRWIDTKNDKDDFKNLEKVLQEKRIEFDFSKAEKTFKKDFEAIKSGNAEKKEGNVINCATSENNKNESKENLNVNNINNLNNSIDLICNFR